MKAELLVNGTDLAPEEIADAVRVDTRPPDGAA